MGIITDRNLTWSDYIDTVKTKLQKITLSVLYKTRHFLNEKALWFFILCLWAMLDMACCAGDKQIKNV